MATTPDGEEEKFQGIERLTRVAKAAASSSSTRPALVAAAAGLAIGFDRPAQAISTAILIYVATRK
jgi:hypothetical protein